MCDSDLMAHVPVTLEENIVTLFLRIGIANEHETMEISSVETWKRKKPRNHTTRDEKLFFFEQGRMKNFHES